MSRNPVATQCRGEDCPPNDANPIPIVMLASTANNASAEEGLRYSKCSPNGDVCQRSNTFTPIAILTLRTSRRESRWLYALQGFTLAASKTRPCHGSGEFGNDKPEDSIAMPVEEFVRPSI